MAYQKPIAKHTGDKKIIYEPYIPSVLKMKVFLKITEIGSSIKQNLENIIRAKMEKRCTENGFIRPNSIHILEYSAGKVCGELIEYMVVFECMICSPQEGMKVECSCKTITKAGIHAEVVDRDGNIPIVVYIARDHHIDNSMFEHVVENTKMVASVVGVHYELNDPHISVIARLSEIVQ